MAEQPVRKKRKVSEKTTGVSGSEPKAKPNPDQLPKRTLYLNNLGDHIGSNKLRTNLYLLFSIYGEVIKITVNTRRLRGQAFVTMRTIDESNLALISLNNEPFFGKPLEISFSNNDTTRLD
ncbi:hypothetical protein HG535_0F02970 [Zygotorulaspora mrakii]|uniref:RRM domain-containing protein n=1 Tax=Zygotorulaspora mrakii TaxID=42260 RepID=A0A7H9B646_ZYGMR|nr:uncharacterized protein HG535_0F02970 [Zygotorulaspora mrakii]QLG73786.1 hypothetical protein HG535_0F02970 [Zygotorulaspora mrakii]